MATESLKEKLKHLACFSWRDQSDWNTLRDVVKVMATEKTNKSQFWIMFLDQPQAKAMLRKIEELSKVASQEAANTQALDKLMATYRSMKEQMSQGAIDYMQMFDLAKEHGPLLANHIKSLRADATRYTYLDSRSKPVKETIELLVTFCSPIGPTVAIQ